MSVTVTTDMFCDKCMTWFTASVGRSVQYRKAVKMAKEKGWTVLPDRTSYCVHCASGAPDKPFPYYYGENE